MGLCILDVQYVGIESIALMESLSRYTDGRERVLLYYSYEPIGGHADSHLPFLVRKVVQDGQLKYRFA